MPVANVRGVSLNYEIVGDRGPWLALMPGGRRGYREFVNLARKIAAQGFRVFLHDRRNCGASEVVFDDSDAEDAIWAEDLHELLRQHNALPAFVGGSSSGCRTSLLFYLRHSKDVKGLLLMRVTGGAFAAKRLPENYYEQFIRAVNEGGMDAVASMDHWKERIAERPANHETLTKTPKERFLKVMTTWRDHFLKGVDMPVLGVSAEQLSSIDVPTIVVPGNDKIHSSVSGRTAHSLIPNAVLHALPLADSEADLVPYEDWAPYEDEIAASFVKLMREAEARRGSADAA